jgi:hypothetical protein
MRKNIFTIANCHDSCGYSRAPFCRKLLPASNAGDLSPSPLPKGFPSPPQVSFPRKEVRFAQRGPPMEAREKKYALHLGSKFENLWLLSVCGFDPISGADGFFKLICQKLTPGSGNQKNAATSLAG